MKDDDADNYKRRVYGGFTIGFALIIAGIVLCVLCTLLGIVSFMMTKNQSSGANNADTQSKADNSKDGSLDRGHRRVRHDQDHAKQAAMRQAGRLS